MPKKVDINEALRAGAAGRQIEINRRLAKDARGLNRNKIVFTKASEPLRNAVCLNGPNIIVLSPDSSLIKLTKQGKLNKKKRSLILENRNLNKKNLTDMETDEDLINTKKANLFNQTN
uniref:Uncharacterized protein n=1 Tax=Acrobeloides nanus TaxID=290746 RepID=A0A914DJZ9_9BILA